MLNNTYGDYAANGHEFIITETDIPRHWYNYLWNDNYITFVSQAGAGDGILQDPLGRRLSLVCDRSLFALEGEKHWGIAGLPVEEKHDHYSCTHGHGYTVIETEDHGIRTELTFFVPGSDSCELWNLKITNTMDAPRSPKIMGYFGTLVDSVYVRQGYNLSTSRYDDDLCGVVSMNRTSFGGKPKTPYYSFMALTERPDGYDGTVNAYIGPYGSCAYPAAVRRGGLTNNGGNGEKLGFALEKKFDLAPGETKNVTFVCGLAFSMEEAVSMREKFAAAGAVEAELAAVKAKFTSQIEDVTIHTPDGELNKLFAWLKHESNLGSRWARVRHNGYRDMTSDCDCLAAVNPRLAFERFKRVLTYQYPTGYAPRTFRDGKIADNNFADNTVWITFTAASILKELGDASILDESVAFNDGSSASFYEHVRRSVEFLCNFRGTHDLIRIWGGDWNDCMNTAGLQGKGVSIRLSLAWLRAAKMFAEIAEIAGKPADAAWARERAEEMQAIINKHGWDGEYYLDAINDWGEKIGSKECEEGKMFLIPQIWAVFSGVSDCGREKIAMDAVEKYLNTPLGTVVSAPAYTKLDTHIGGVTEKPAGVHENGGVYLHTIAWKIAADAMLKRAENVAKDIETILPFRNKVVNGRAEPYVMCNSYFGHQTGYRYGTPGQSWRTAAGQWFEKALVNYVFGLMPEMEGLRVDPCLPPLWTQCRIEKKFRDAVYEITYDNHGTKIGSITVDGKEIEGTVLPYEAGKRYSVVVTTR